MTWKSPVIDHKPTDTFNISDYERIRENLLYLKSICSKLYAIDDYNSMDVVNDVSMLPYPRRINALEKNLEILNKTTYNYNIGTTKIYYANERYITADEVNRIEQAIKKIKETADGQLGSLNHLGFRFGTKTFGKRTK